jgi:hypothetical protein
MNYAIVMGSGALIYVPSFIKIDSAIQSWYGGGIHRHTDSKVVSYAYFYFFKIRKVGKKRMHYVEDISVHLLSA